MNTSKKCCAIVDAYSAARFYPSYFKQQGYNCIHVQSIKNLPEVFRRSFSEKLYVENLILDDNFEEIVTKLKSYNVKVVLPGVEPGVLLADKLCHALDLEHNVFALSEARRNKYLMGETLREHDLNYIKQIRSNNLKEILNWVKCNTTWPVIIKPLDSTGSEGVHLCRTEDELSKNFDALHDKTNLMNSINENVLVQEYISGDEYVINAVSSNGKHYITDIWVYRKKQLESGHLIYDFDELLPYHGEIQSQLIEYQIQVLNALGIKNGATHAELKYSTNGPVLIEVGARLHGLLFPPGIRECIGYDQAELSCLSYVEPEALKSRLRKPYDIQKNMITVSLCSNKTGRIKKINSDIWNNLESFSGMLIKKNIGDTLNKTIDLISSPGYVCLVHEDKKVLECDYREIQRGTEYLIEITP